MVRSKGTLLLRPEPHKRRIISLRIRWQAENCLKVGLGEAFQSAVTARAAMRNPGDAGHPLMPKKPVAGHPGRGYGRHSPVRPALRYLFVMPIDNLQEAAQKIAGLLANLNRLGGFRLKYRITAGEGARDPQGLEGRVIYVELGGPDVPLVTQHNGELLRAVETIAAQMLRLDQREHDLISIDAGNFKALRAEELRMEAETAAEKVRKSGVPYAFPPM